MAEGNALGARNSPRHRSGNLLCTNLIGRLESTSGIPLEHFPDLRPRAPKSIGEPAFSTEAVMVPILGHDGGFQVVHGMDYLAPEYYVDYPPPIPACTPHAAEQFSGYYPMTNCGFAAATQDSIMTTPQPFDTSIDSGGFCGPLVAHHQPTPPAAPESPLPSNPSFHYHPCRWQGGPPCDGFAPGRNREMGEHLRAVHCFVGHERDKVQCEWEHCGQRMQRMNVARHIVSRHLLAAASCRFCAKPFSRPDVVSRHEKTCSSALLV